MTTVRAAPALVLLLALPALLPVGGAQVAVPETITGSATLSRFQVFSNGFNVEGGLYERTLLCRSCHIRMNVTASDLTTVENGASHTLAPGLYEIRGFAGTFHYTQEGLGVFSVEIDGVGGIKPTS